MPQQMDRDEPDARRERKGFFRRSLPLEHETTLYILVSALDVFMTYILLRSGKFTEGNPVARYFYFGWGMRGMVYFKFGMVAFICVITQIIAARRLATARRVLHLATFVVSAVVIYSLVLYIRHSD